MQNKQQIEESESDEGLMQDDDDEVVVRIKDKAPADRDSDSEDSDSDQSDGCNQNENQEIADTMLLKPVFVNREDRAILEPSLQLQEQARKEEEAKLMEDKLKDQKKS